MEFEWIVNMAIEKDLSTGEALFDLDNNLFKYRDMG